MRGFLLVKRHVDVTLFKTLYSIVIPDGVDIHVLLFSSFMQRRMPSPLRFFVGSADDHRFFYVFTEKCALLRFENSSLSQGIIRLKPETYFKSKEMANME